MRRTLAMLAVIPVLTSAPAQGQELLQRIGSAPDGAVLFSFPAKPGVCGYGDNIHVRGPDGDRVVTYRGARSDSDDWQARCEEGPVRVRLEVRGGAVTDVDARVGSRFAATDRATDLGTLPAEEAVDLLIGIAERAPTGVGDDALFPTVLAAGVDPAARLLRVAGNEAVPSKTREKAVFWAAEAGASTAELARTYAGAEDEEVREQILFAYSRLEEPAATRELLRIARAEGGVGLRKKAVFWLGQAAGREIARDLGSLVEEDGVDSEIREHALFALSRRPADEGIPALVRVARTSPDPRLRKKALFWLGQSGDPRALELFEEILVR